MTLFGLLLLVVAVAGAIAPLAARGVPSWVVPVAAALVALLTGVATGHGAGTALRPLVDPLGFLLAAVPLSLLLDRAGLFEALARRAAAGTHSLLGLWVLASVVTTTLNLDASVVLLTPLYVRIARRRGIDPLGLGLQPVLLASLASSALPVSNLTNLIAVARAQLGVGAVLAHLGPPSLAATVVGWLCYRRAYARRLTAAGPAALAGARAVHGRGGPAEDPVDDAKWERRTVVAGLVAGLVVVGFGAGSLIGAQPWEVAAGGDVVLLSLVRTLPWRAVPAGLALTVSSLGLLAGAVASRLHVGALLTGSSAADILRTVGLTALAANLVNNLPTLLVAVNHLPPHASWPLWASLVGVNVGPTLLVTGSLASLLWVSTLRRLEVPVGAADFARAGLLVGLPSLAAATGALFACRAVLGGP